MSSCYAPCLARSLFVERAGDRLEVRPVHLNPARYLVTRCGRYVFELDADGAVRRELPQSPAQGYPAVTLVTSDGAPVRKRVHRLVCRAYHGPPPDDGALVRHLDDDRANNHACNLRWGDQLDNWLDAVRNGAIELQLTPCRVRVLRLAYLEGESVRTLAERVGLPESTVRAAIMGRTWSHVDDPLPAPEVPPSHRAPLDRWRYRRRRQQLLEPMDRAGELDADGGWWW